MNILIIEDEPAIRDTLQLCLELHGHTVLTAADGPAGVRQATQQQPDLILCDVGLPSLDGYGVIAAIRQLPAGRDIPFIFLTALAGPDDLRKAMNLGANGYVVKPFTQRDIMDVIRTHGRPSPAGPEPAAGTEPPPR
jgi:CheY-like chemotaxis protein